MTSRSASNSYNSGVWAWSTDGVNFTTMDGVNTCPATSANIATLQTVDFSSVTALNNASNVMLRYTLSHTTTVPPPDRFVTIDNLQLNTDPILIPKCPADIDGNKSVNVDDLLAVINTWGPCLNPDDCPADIAPIGPPQGNGVVDVDDLLMVINGWGECK